MKGLKQSQSVLIDFIHPFNLVQKLVDNVAEVAEAIPSPKPKQSGPTPEECLDLLENPNTIICMWSPLYVRIEQSYPGLVHPLVAPILSSEEKPFGAMPIPTSFFESPVYFSYFVVSKNSNYFSANDLIQNGTRFGVNGADSLSGFHCIRAWIHENNVPYEKFKFYETGAHFNSMAWISTGKLDVAAVDIFCLLKLRRDNPEIFSNIRVITETILGPYPSQPIVIGKDSLPVKEKLKEGFLNVGKDVLAASFQSRFAEVNPDNYIGLEKLLEEIKHVRPSFHRRVEAKADPIERMEHLKNMMSKL